MSSGVSRATTADLSDPNIWGDTADGRALAASNGVWLSVLDCWDNGISSHVLSPSQQVRHLMIVDYCCMFTNTADSTRVSSEGC